MQPQSARNKKIIKIAGAALVSGIALVTLFLNCSGSSFTAASIDAEYSQQASTIDISISAQPVASTLMVGTTLTLAVTASGGSTLYYQWYKDGTAIDSASSASYSVQSATTADAGSYCVIIWDASGSVISSNAAVAVNANPNAPVITAQPAAVVSSLGSSTGFSVTATSAVSTDTVTYQWYHNGAAVSGATNSVYSISSLASSDAGSYYVVVTNSVTSVTSTSVTLSIVAAN